MIPRPLAVTRGLATAALAASLGCGGDLTLPGDGSTNFQMSVIGGNQQTGTVGQELPKPVVVKVLGNGDLPLSGRLVAFVSPDPSATRFDPDTAVTNSEGVAEASWVLGTAPGDYQAEARLVVPDAAEPPIAQFSASAVAADADTLRALSPLSQPGRRGEALAPLVVIVVDRFGNPVPGVKVDWDVAAGKGEVSQSETGTGSDGTASVVWTLGDRVGVHVVTARVKEGDVSGSPVTFTATVLF
jgi:hypothetical protein